MKQSRLVIITLVVLLLAAAVLSAPVMAAAGTTEVRIAKYANDRSTVLNETTVD